MTIKITTYSDLYNACADLVEWHMAASTLQIQLVGSPEKDALWNHIHEYEMTRVSQLAERIGVVDPEGRSLVFDALLFADEAAGFEDAESATDSLVDALMAEFDLELT